LPLIGLEKKKKVKFDMLCRQQCDERIKLRQKQCIIGQESRFQIEMVQSSRVFFPFMEGEGVKRWKGQY